MSDYADICIEGLKKSRRKVSQVNRRTCRNSSRSFYKYKSTDLDTPLPPRKAEFNTLKTKRRLLYLKTQFVPLSKHFLSQL